MSGRLTNIGEVSKGVCRRLVTPEIVIPAAATLVSVVAGWLLVRNAFTVMTGDAVAYWDMAQAPIDPGSEWWWGNVPYTYRIAVPFVVRNVFASSLSGFILIAISSLFICNYLVLKISQLFARDIRVGLLLVIIFSTNFTIFTPLVNPALVDLPSFVFMLLLAFIFFKYVIVEEATSKTTWLLYSATLLVAMLIKEWIGFALPLFFIFLLYTGKSKKAIQILLYAIPAVAVHLTIRLIMGPLFPGIQNPELALLVERYFTTIGAYRSLFATFGAIWLVIPLALVYSYRNKRALRHTYVPVILAFIVFLPMGTIASDHNRYLFFISFPFLIPSLSIYFAEHNESLKRSALYTVLSLFLISRLAMHYRPEMQEGFAPTAGQSDAVLVLIAVAAVIQVLAMLYYAVAPHARTLLPGVMPKAA